MRYLDPKADLTFKKIFGKHPDLLISLLNALLPLSDDEQIESIEYLPTELVPELYEHKNSIVDVLCKDIRGRQFCVEMQMEWTTAFKQRVLFNASKLYVTQAKKKGQYKDLRPVYSLNLVNEIFEPDLEEYQHDYKIVCDKHTDRVIEGLYFTFIELPKITPHTVAEKRMAVLWLRFLTEIDDDTQTPPADLQENPEINKALEEVEVSGFTEEELRGYDKFWDIVRTEKTLLDGNYEKGLADGIEEGIAKGERKEKLATAKRLLALGLAPDIAAQGSGLKIEEIKALIK